MANRGIADAEFPLKFLETLARMGADCFECVLHSVGEAFPQEMETSELRTRFLLSLKFLEF